MIKHFLCLFCILFCSLFIKGQGYKNQIHLKTGFGFRITPVDLKSPGYLRDELVPVYFERDKQLTATVINYSASYFLSNKFSISIGGSARYDHVYFKDVSTGIKHEHRDLITDFHFAINRLLQLSKNRIIVSAGYSSMNNGTNYVYSERLIMMPFDTIYLFKNSNFNFSTVDLGMAYQWKRISFELINRVTVKHKFNQRGPLLLPEIRLSYSFSLKNENL